MRLWGFLLSQHHSHSRSGAGVGAQGPSDELILQGGERVLLPLLPGSFSNAFHHPSPVENSSVFVSAQTCRALSCPQLGVG